jgi:ribonuclease III
MQRVVTRADLESIVGFPIQNIAVFQHAFIHVSALKENAELGDSYERLEFIGDSVINFVVGKYLYDKYADKKEGFLTRIRTKIVSGKCLSDFSRRLRLHEYVFMDQKGTRNRWHENERILEDVFEALVGAIYTDAGLVVARDFVIRCIESFVDFGAITKDTNYKDILMRWTQATGTPLPQYVARECRDASTRAFRVNCFANRQLCGHAVAYTKKDAEQMAAKGALLALNVDIHECFIE